MVKVDLKGIAKVTAKGRDYWYAWRGGPRLRGQPGTPEFIASYNEAIESRRTPDTGRFRGVVTAYKANKAFQNLATSTQKNWHPWLDRISDHFGDLSIRQFDRTDKFRPVIRRWRSQWEDTPRTADYALQVLSTVLSFAVDPLGKIASNPCEGIKRIYSTDRSEIIWTDAEIAEFKGARTKQDNPACSKELALAVDLAAFTGLRLGDLVRLSWSHVGEDAIELRTNKSRHKREAIVPLYDDLRAVLASIPKRSTVILTSSRGKPWTSSGLSTAVQRVKDAAGWQDKDLNFNDLRGTAATKFYNAGIPLRAIAEIMGWSEDTVEKIIRRYVGKQAATKAWIAEINKARKGT
jgi:integrase